MTIICIKDRKLAWDSQVTSNGGFRWGEISDKVVRVNRGDNCHYVGGCGNLQSIQAYVRRIRDMPAEDFLQWVKDPKHQSDRSSTLFLFDPKTETIFEFQDKGNAVRLSLSRKSYAIGTGYEYAYGVMDAGRSALEAVKMVIGRFDGCGLPIHRSEWRKK